MITAPLFAADLDAAWAILDPATPYRRGLEDAIYARIYAAPSRTNERAEYRRGWEDGRRAKMAAFVDTQEGIV